MFAQGEDATEPLEILVNRGEKAAIDYLAQWHDPGKHMTRGFNLVTDNIKGIVELPHTNLERSHELLV